MQNSGGNLEEGKEHSEGVIKVYAYQKEKIQASSSSTHKQKTKTAVPAAQVQ